MKKFAVAHVSHDNELKVEVHEASDWREALLKHSAFDSLKKDHPDYIEDIPYYLEEAKEYFSDGEILIDVIPVPTNQVIKL